MTQAARSLEIEIIHELQRAFSALQEIGALLVPRKPYHRCGPLRTRQERGKARTRARESERLFKRQVRDLGSARGYLLFSQAHWAHFGVGPHDDMTSNKYDWREFERTHVVRYEPGRLTISARSTNQ